MHRSVIHIIQSVLVKQFYKVNTGFFLFWFFLLFGVVAGGQIVGYHLSLIHGMIESPVFLFCVIVIWFLYTLKCISYITKQLTEPKQNFLFTLTVLPERKQYVYLLWVHIQVYMPVLLYTIVVAAVAAKHHHFGSMAAVMASNLFFISISAAVYMRYMQKRITGIAIHFSFLRFSFPKPFFSLPLWFTWKDRTQMLLATKTFSLLLLYGFITLYTPDKPDLRPLLLVMMLVAAAHSAIILQIRSFEEERLVFSKNLPVSIPRRFLLLLWMYFVLLLPELVFIWKGFPLHFRPTDLPQIVLLSVSLPAFFHSLLLMKDMDTENYYRLVFITCAALFFIILYDPGIILPALLLLLSYVLYHAHLHDFEKKMRSLPNGA